MLYNLCGFNGFWLFYKILTDSVHKYVHVLCSYMLTIKNLFNKRMILVCPRIFMQHIWKFFSKRTHTCEKSAVEIDQREYIQDAFIDTFIIFHSEKLTWAKTDIWVRRFIMWNVYNYSPVVPLQKSPGIPCTIFHC